MSWDFVSVIVFAQNHLPFGRLHSWRNHYIRETEQSTVGRNSLCCKTSLILHTEYLMCIWKWNTSGVITVIGNWQVSCVRLAICSVNDIKWYFRMGTELVSLLEMLLELVKGDRYVNVHYIEQCACLLVWQNKLKWICVSFQISGTILDNYARGRTKHIWFSISTDLVVDARR